MMFLRRLILLIVVPLVVASGLAWPLGYGQYALWPFSQAWHMFSSNGGSHYQLEVTGELADGRLVRVPMERWFTYEVTPFTRRYNEISREPANVAALVRYVCKHDRELRSVTVSDYTWPIEAGRRRPHDELPEGEAHAWRHVDRMACAGLGE